MNEDWKQLKQSFVGNLRKSENILLESTIRFIRRFIMDYAWYMHEQWVKSNHAFSGWKNAYTNGHICVIFNGKANPLTISAKRQGTETFSILSLEATAAWLDNLQVNIIGRRNKQDLHSTTMVLQFDSSQVVYLDWKEIDEIQFTPTSGTAHPGIDYSEKYFAITWILLG